VRRVVEAVEAGAPVAIGSRAHAQSLAVVRADRTREVSGRVFNAITSCVLRHRYPDTQCGLKALRGDVARELAARMRIDGFAFDVELLRLAERRHLEVVQVPVSMSAASTSTVRLRSHAPQMVRDIIRIAWYDRSGAYDAAS
jgi:hypothetical protein